MHSRAKCQCQQHESRDITARITIWVRTCLIIGRVPAVADRLAAAPQLHTVMIGAEIGTEIETGIATATATGAEMRRKCKLAK